MDSLSNSHIDMFTKYYKYTSDVPNIKNKKFIHIINQFNQLINTALKWADHNYDSIKIKSIPFNKYTDHFESNYFNSSIKTYILNHIKYEIQYTFHIHNRSICVHMMTSIPIHVSIYTRWLKLIMSWVHVAQTFSNDICGLNVNIYLYMTPFTKCMPHNNVIGVNHVNSGLSNTCAKNSMIVIYRQEEWFKVFIHEIFHNFGLDFSHINNNYDLLLKSTFNIKPKIALYETYTEFWARLINTIYSANQLSNNNDFYEYFQVLLYYERCLSMYQCLKILHYQQMSYTDIFNNNSYNEQTNVFAYYIGVAILMTDPVNYVLNQLNTSLNLRITNVKYFYEYIVTQAKQKSTIKYFVDMSPLIHMIQLESNRMSLCLNV